MTDYDQLTRQEVRDEAFASNDETHRVASGNRSRAPVWQGHQISARFLRITTG